VPHEGEAAADMGGEASAHDSNTRKSIESMPADARAYLSAHNVEAAIKEAINRVLASRPADPIRAIAEMLNPDLPPLDGYAAKLGAYHQPVSTSSAVAQRWFDRGWVWLAGFHREEAAFCFSSAIVADADCAMGHWGLALAHGPDYNFSAQSGYFAVAAQPEGYPSLNVAVKAIQTALALLDGGKPCTARERALIEALATRYEYPPLDTTPQLQERYMAAMAQVADAYPRDADVQAIYAEACMCLAPWDLYTKNAGVATPNWYTAGVTNPHRSSSALSASLRADGL